VVTITNTSATPVVAFFLRADVRRGNNHGPEQAGDNQAFITPQLPGDGSYPGDGQPGATRRQQYRGAHSHHG
jgi:exo-1,4-beta-D-glucosaminidase